MDYLKAVDCVCFNCREDTLNDEGICESCPVRKSANAYKEIESEIIKPTDERQKRYDELSDKLDELADDEQDFIAWLSVKRLREAFLERKRDMRIYSDSQSIGEQFYIAECVRVLKYVADELCNNLF